jgi:hypothetical protein
MINEWTSLFSSTLVDIDNITYSHTVAPSEAQVTHSRLESSDGETASQSQHAQTIPHQGSNLTHNYPEQVGMANMTTSPSNILENALGVAYAAPEATSKCHEEHTRHEQGPANKADTYAIPVDANDPKEVYIPATGSIHSQPKTEPRNMSRFIKAGVELAFLVSILNGIQEYTLMVHGQELMQEYTHNLQPEDLLSIQKKYKMWLMGAR